MKITIGKKEIAVIAISVSATVAGINASDKLMGKSETEQPGPCPTDMVFIESASGGFCLDKYEASAGPECPSQNPSAQEDTRINIAEIGCAPLSQAGMKPWVNVSQNQAAEACAKAKKRLPTNSEWQAASLGTPDPVGSWGTDDCQVSGNWDEQPGLTGSGKNCVSSFGVYDMIGNVWEWVSDTIENGKIGEFELPGQGFVTGVDGQGFPIESAEVGSEDYAQDYLWIKKTDVRGLARGGYWDNGEKAGKYASYIVSQPSSSGKGVGFRCAQSTMR